MAGSLFYQNLGEKTPSFKAGIQESRWYALQVLEKMSAQFAAEFTKTEQGMELFQSFAGDDAVDARFFLASLPGKRLAGRYLLED